MTVALSAATADRRQDYVVKRAKLPLSLYSKLYLPVGSILTYDFMAYNLSSNKAVNQKQIRESSAIPLSISPLAMPPKPSSSSVEAGSPVT